MIQAQVGFYFIRKIIQINDKNIDQKTKEEQMAEKESETFIRCLNVCKISSKDYYFQVCKMYHEERLSVNTPMEEHITYLATKAVGCEDEEYLDSTDKEKVFIFKKGFKKAVKLLKFGE